MTKRFLTLCVVLYSVPHQNTGIFAASSDTESTMTSSWLGHWSVEKPPQETVTVDESSGCICRLKPDHHVVCYGATTCASFPKNVTLPLGVYDFRLKTTMINICSAGDLSGLHRLRRFDIIANFRLNKIEPGFFSGMTNIVNLSISFNTDLKFLHEATFKGLDKLRRLELIKNGFQKIIDVSRALKMSLLPRLTSLSLSENVFTEINESSFNGLNGTNLTELDLVLCQIEKIHPKAIMPFRRLEKLRVGENIFQEGQLERLLEQMAVEDIPVKLLNLYELGYRKGNKLTSLLRIIAKLKICHLNLRRNHLESLYDGLFPVMPDLHTLDLREVSVVTIEPNALNEIVMPKLKVLLLGGNRLSGVMPGILLPQLSDLDLSANTGIYLLPSYFDVNSNIFENMTQLVSLNLSFNRIVSISNVTFNRIHNLKILGLKNATIFYIAQNSFQMLRNLFLLNLEDNPFRPFNTFPDLIFQGLERLEILLLANCGITHFSRPDIFESLTSLKYLNLKRNKLITIIWDMLRPLPWLTGLDISSNQLTPWDYPNNSSRFNIRLKIILLQCNRFTHITKAMLDDFDGVQRLDLSKNPFVCDSNLLEPVNSWLMSRNLALNETNLFDESYVCLSPQNWRDKSLINFLTNTDRIHPQFMSTNVQKYLILVIATLIIIFFILIIAYYYRWHIRYWIFLAKKGYLRHTYFLRNKRPKSFSISYKYDAFVSYCHEDRNFVIRLVSELENEEPYLKLCVYERDFEIGTVISETVMDKVSASRKVIFIISNAFAQSQWCIWELQLAEYNRVFSREDFLNDSLIMIKLGPIMKCFATPILKYMLKTRIYLEWSTDYKKQRLFWDKLRNCIISNIGKETMNI